jgi:homoserine O-acetyltransferase
MGGMQTFQWVVSYPDFMDKAVAVVGTPKQTSYDLLLWKAELSLIESLRGVPDGGRKAMETNADIQDLCLQTPAYIVEHTPPEAIDAAMTKHRQSLAKRDPLDYASQLRAMIDHDIYRQFGGSAEATANAVRTKLLVIVSLQDHMVQPAPAREFARLAKANVVTLTGDCGHLASGCEQELVKREVWRFLGQ